jgi:hypothetical protein
MGQYHLSEARSYLVKKFPTLYATWRFVSSGLCRKLLMALASAAILICEPLKTHEHTFISHDCGNNETQGSFNFNIIPDIDDQVIPVLSPPTNICMHFADLS